MSDSLLYVWLLFIVLVAGFLLYSFFKRKTKDSKAARLVYLISFFGAMISGFRLVAPKFITITDAIDDWFLYVAAIFAILFFSVSFYAATTKKDKTPYQNYMYKNAIISISIALVAFLVLILLIATD